MDGKNNEKEYAMSRTPLQNAIKWIDGQLHGNPSKNIAELISEAGQKFNLSPVQSETLTQIFSGKKDEKKNSSI